MTRVWVGVILLLGAVGLFRPAQSHAAVQVTVLNRGLVPVERLTDGDAVRLRVSLSAPVSQPTTVSFAIDTPETFVAQCTIAASGDHCYTDMLLSLGWYWTPSGHAAPLRRLLAVSPNLAETLSTTIHLMPRPVVLAHGLNSNATTWQRYLGPDGYLATLGLHGFAVGDGQVEGVMNTGDFTAPTQPTNTIAENAAILGEYIAQVRELTGAEQVDLVAHSMGGLIARYYIDRLMPAREVAQLITIGTPHEGSDCANLPAALGFYLPASHELRSSYVRDIFNRQITRRAGVPFYAIAGTPLIEDVQGICTRVPNDLVVSIDSAFAIDAPSAQVPVLHTALTESDLVFTEQVKPLLQRTLGGFVGQPDPAPDWRPQPALQFTHVLTGHVAAGASETRTVHIDQATIASFALFDPTQSLTVTVRGASGAVLALSPDTNGLIRVDDPAALMHLGYGFRNPRPGPWQVTLTSTASTPSQGAAYALTAHLTGGATLQAETSQLLPRLGEAVEVTARLELAGQELTIQSAQADIGGPDGAHRTLVMRPQGGGYQGAWRPSQAGLHTVDVVVIGLAPDGSHIERTAFLTVEAQPSAGAVQVRQVGLSVGIILLVMAGLVAWRMKSRG